MAEVAGPYRPHPPPDPELARLAMQGKQRRAELAAGRRVGQQKAGVGHLRTAIGAYRGSPLKRCMLAAIALGLLSGGLGVALAEVGNTEIGAISMPGFVIAFILFMIYVFVPPIASQGAMTAEQAWMRALPFELRGYFEALSDEPSYERSMEYEIVWQDGATTPHAALVHGVFGAVDPNARLDHADARAARIIGSAVSGATGIRTNRVPVYRNHRLAAHVHDVVERALLPLHRSHPIARVSIKG